MMAVSSPGPALPLKSVVLFIACGTMVFIIVFIFAKRQITRFALRSNRGPHATIGTDAPKSMRTEIERRLRLTQEIKHEPHLLTEALEESIPKYFHGETCHFYHRMKAVDAVKQLDAALKDYSALISRSVTQPLRLFLADQRQRGPLQGLQFEVVEKFSSMYDHARHDAMLFTEADYHEYMSLLNTVVEHIKQRKIDENIDNSLPMPYNDGSCLQKDLEISPMNIQMAPSVASSIPASVGASSSEASTVILNDSPAHHIKVQNITQQARNVSEKEISENLDAERRNVAAGVEILPSQTVTQRTLTSRMQKDPIT